MDTFIEDLEKEFHAMYKSENLVKDDIWNLKEGNHPRDQAKQKKLSKLQYKMILKDTQYKKMREYTNKGPSSIKIIKEDDNDLLIAIKEMVDNRIVEFDLKSYDFNSDPDCSYSFAPEKL
jgi:hypothetical protein